MCWVRVEKVTGHFTFFSPVQSPLTLGTAAKGYKIAASDWKKRKKRVFPKKESHKMELLIPVAAALGGLFTLTRGGQGRRRDAEEGFDNDDDDLEDDLLFDDDNNRHGRRVFRADTAAGRAAMSHSVPEFTPMPVFAHEPDLPTRNTDYVMAPPSAASAQVPFDTATETIGGGAAYTGGPAYQSTFLRATPLGGLGGATAAPFYSGAESYMPLTSAASTQLTLDTHTGAGVFHRQKQAMAPLHAPAADLSYAYGTPNQTEAVRAREYVSMKQNGVQPTPQRSEGRGLTLDRSFEGMAAEQGAVGRNNKVDYQPRGTYVDHLAARDFYADRGVDELRTASNPKATEHYMAGFEGPAMNVNAGGGRRLNDDGTQSTPKNRPNTFYENVRELWGGPKSFQHTQSLAPEHVEHITQRQRTQDELGEDGAGYFGAAHGITGGLGSYLMEQDYEPSHRTEVSEMPLGHVDGLTRSAPGAHNDYSRWTQPVHDTNRSSGPNQVYFGATFSSVLGKYVAPLVDALRPARRTVLAEAANDAHALGHFAGAGIGGFGSGTAENDGRALPAEYLLPTTLKEEGMLEDHFGQATATEAQIGAHHAQNARLRATERESTTAHSGYLGAAKGLVPAEALPSAPSRADRQREQTLQGRMQQGSTDKYNPNAGSMGHRKPDVAPPTRAPVASFVASVPSAATFGAVFSKYEHHVPSSVAADNSASTSAASRKRPRAANSLDGGSGGEPFKVRGSASRDTRPAEHDFTNTTELNARLHSRLQERNPFMPAYRVA